MKKFYLLVLASVLLTGQAAVAEVTPQKLTSWRTKSMNVRVPFMNDSINPEGQKYVVTDLLSSDINKTLKDGVKATADTLGTITLSRSAGREGTGILNVMQTAIRSPRFVKGSIRVTSPVAFSFLLDGKEIASKKTVEDSISSVSSASGTIRLEPERDAVLSVRVLSTPTDSIDATVLVEFIPDEEYKDITLYNGPDLKRRLKLADTQFISSAGTNLLSPDGRYLIMKEYSYLDKSITRYRTTLTDLNSGKVLNANLPWRSQWMPDCNIIYYTEKTPDGYDLFTYDPVSGKENLVYSGLPTADFYWAPDGSYFIYSKTLDGVSESGPLRRYATPDDRIPGDRSRSYLLKYTPSSGLSEQLTFGNHSTSLCDISPDGKKIIVSNTRENPKVRPFYSSTFYELDLTTLKADTLVRFGPQFVNSAEYSPDGTQVLFTGSPEAFDGIGRNCAPHPIANDFDVQMFIMDLADKSVKCITKEFNPSVETPVWNRADGKIYFSAQDGFDIPIYCYTPSTGKFDKLPVDVATVRSFDLPARSGHRLVYSGADFNYTGRAFVMDLKTRKNIMLDNPYGKVLDEIELGVTEPWDFTAKDGTTIEGWICYPPQFDKDKKYPMIVYYYGGTSPTQRTFAHPYTPQLLASRDYIVYVLNPSGTTGYGQEFSARHVNAWGDYTASDIIEGVEKFCEAHPYVNRKKIGCIGASYGGFMTQYLQTLTPIFAAAVSHAGISNVTSYWGEGYWGYSYNSVAAADSYPWTNPDLFTKHGSLFNADKINTPLLLLHGTSDTNVPIGESIQLFNALRILGKDVEFVSVDGEDHYISDFDKRLLWQNTIMAWFAKYLQDAPQWWDNLYPERHL